MTIKNNPYLAEYCQELEKVWKNDQHMIDYCLKQTQSLIKLSTGQLFATDKPIIEKDFCFGYSSCGQGPSFDECQEEHADFRSHAAERFKEENLAQFDSFLAKLEDSSTTKQPYLTLVYRPELEANIVTVHFVGLADFDYGYVRKEDYVPMTDEDKQAVKAVYIKDRAAMEKRLDSYLKKYGTSKLHTWTYWIDE